MFIRGRPITMYIPSNIQNYDELKMEPPSERLELDWVYPSTMPRMVYTGVGAMAIAGLLELKQSSATQFCV